MLKQLDIFNTDRAVELADAGLNLAVETANAEHEDWGDRCWKLFLVWLPTHVKHGNTFQVEDFREYVHNYDLLEKPKSNRAFGIIARRGKNKVFEFAGIGKVRNVKAHCANATVWRRV